MCLSFNYVSPGAVLLCVQLFEDYDLVAIQEVIHKEGLDEIKKLLSGWDYVSSHSSVGRVRKEFYAFFYRSERIQVVAVRVPFFFFFFEYRMLVTCCLF